MPVLRLCIEVHFIVAPAHDTSVGCTGYFADPEMNSTASLASDRSVSKGDFGSPSFVLLSTEPLRAVFEYAAMRSM